eukprot:UN10163
MTVAILAIPPHNSGLYHRNNSPFHRHNTLVEQFCRWFLPTTARRIPART